MMPRKKRLAIIISIVTLIIILIVGILAFLYIKTDAFKTNETLFTKYFIQNFNIADTLLTDNSSQIQEVLDNNKYTSELTGKLEYTENIGTSDENQKNPVNDAQLKISSQTDKKNNYYYKDIKIVKEDENLIRAEYLNENKVYGIRLDGIKQFVSVDMDKINDNNAQENSELKNIDSLLTNVDIKGAITFTDEEKQTLQNTYLNIIKSNVSKDKYSKQANSIITVNNKSVTTNAYTITLTKEQYNNLIVKVLEQVSNDEIILSKIDNVENIIKEKYSSYDSEKSLREEFVEEINKEVEDIQNNNIGNDEVKITVYESKGKTTRTTIQTNTGKLNIDLYNNVIKFDNIEYSQTENEQIIQIEKNSSENEEDISIEYEKIEDNEITADVELKSNQKMENGNIKNQIELSLKNDKYKTVLTIDDNIEIVDKFENQINIEDNNVELSSLDEDKTTTITNILLGNIQTQIQKFNDSVPLQNYVKMLQNLNLLKNNSIDISDNVDITETEKNRFNSQFEYFASQNLTTDDVNELINSFSDNFEDMYIVLKNGEETDVDTEQLDRNTSSSSDYIKNIDEIDVKIKQNTTNDNKKEKLQKLIEKINKKYDVSLEYGDNGLVNKVKLKIKNN